MSKQPVNNKLSTYTEADIEGLEATVASLEQEIEKVKDQAMVYAKDRDRLLKENVKLHEKIDTVLDFLKQWIKGN